MITFTIRCADCLQEAPEDIYARGGEWECACPNGYNVTELLGNREVVGSLTERINGGERA